MNMSLELLDLVTVLYENGGLVIFGFIAAGLFGLQTYFSFMLWKNGAESYLARFISYHIATLIFLFSSINYVISLQGPSNYDLLVFTMFFFLIGATIAAGIQIFVFIQKKWLRKEENA